MIILGENGLHLSKDFAADLLSINALLPNVHAVVPRAESRGTAPSHLLSQMASTEMLYCRNSLATWAAFFVSCRVRTFHVSILVLLPFIVNPMASCGLAPDGIIQLSEEAFSGVRPAVVEVICIVCVSVIVQYPLVGD